MDELIIGEKKYISSKQAAKVTGYAKDYIGQLCREGRVPARLVGRSWYVLESALHDHRFGEPKETSVDETEWESPRYVATNTEVLPSINRLQTVNEEEEGETPQRLQDTWQAWFDRFDSVANTPVVGRVRTRESEEEEKEIPIEQKEVSIPIRTMYHEQQYQQLEESVLQPQIEPLGGALNKSDKDRGRNERGYSGQQRVFRTIQIAGVLFAGIMITLAAFGSGYLDKYIISNSQVGVVAGIILYNK